MTAPPAHESVLTASTSKSAAPGDATALDDQLIATIDVMFRRHGQLLRRAMAATEGDDRLSLPQLRCLQAMAETNGPALTTRLARELLVTAPTMTRTIDGLVERGLVERQPDPANRRQIDLVLTPAGLELLNRYREAIASRTRAVLSPLDAGAKERLLAAVSDIATLLDADERATGGGMGA